MASASSIDPRLTAKTAAEMMAALAKAFQSGAVDSKQYSTISQAIYDGLTKEISKSDSGGTKKASEGLIGSMSGFFKAATGMLPRHYETIANSIIDGVGVGIKKNGAVLGSILIASLSAAVDLQQDLRKIIIQNTGNMTNAYKDVANGINEVSMATGMTQDSLVAITNQLSQVGLLGRMSKADLKGNIEVYGEWHRTFGMSADQIGKVAYGLNKLGVKGTENLKMLRDSAFKLSKEQNMSLEEFNQGVAEAVTLTMQWGLTGSSSTQAVVSGLIRAQGLYKELGLSTQAATDAAKKFGQITDQDTIRALSQMSVMTGKSIDQLNRLRQTDFGEFMAVRANSALKAMGQTANNLGITMEKMYASGPKDAKTQQSIELLKKQIGMQFAMSSEEVDKLYSGMQKYVAENTAGMNDGIAKHQKILQLQNSYIKDLQIKNKQEADANKSIEAANQMLGTVINRLKSMAQSLLVAVGMPLLQILNSLLTLLLPIIEGLGSIVSLLTSIRGLMPVVTALVTTLFLFRKFPGLMALNRTAVVAFSSAFNPGTSVISKMWVALKSVVSQAKHMGSATSIGTKIASVGFNRMGLAIRGAGLALRGLLLSNPLGWIITALMLIVEYWEDINGLINKYLPGLKEVGSFLLSGILTPFKAIWEVVSAIGTAGITPFIMVYDAVKDLFSLFSFSGKDSGDSIFSYLVKPLQWVWSIVKEIGAWYLKVVLAPFKATGAVIRGIGTLIGTAVSAPFKIFGALVTFVKDIFSGSFSDAVSKLGKTLFSVILSPFKVIWEVVKDIFGIFISIIPDSIKSVGGAIVDFIMKPFDIIKAAVDKIMAVWTWWKGEKKDGGGGSSVASVARATGAGSSSLGNADLGLSGVDVSNAVQKKVTMESKQPTALPDTTIQKKAANLSPSQSFSNELGSLSAKYESGSKGSGAIGFDTTGGTSYGKYQIATKTGTMDNFMKYVQANNKEVADQLSPLMGSKGDKTGAFAQKWKELAASGKMGDLEHGFIKQSHFDPAANALMKKNGFDISKRSKALQDVLWSTSVQHGAGGASSIFGKLDLNKMSDEDIIKKVYADRGTKFGSSTAAVQASVLNRFSQEKVQALAALEKEKNNPSIQNQTAQAPAISQEAQQAMIKMANNVEKDVSRRKQDSDYARVKAAGRDTGDFGVNSQTAEGAV